MRKPRVDEDRGDEMLSLDEIQDAFQQQLALL